MRLRSLSGRGAAARDPKLTSPGQLLGTPLYMAPEQLRASPDVDPRADLYALGATVYHALAGAPPFPGQGLSLAEFAAKVLDEPPPPVAGIPRALNAVLLRLLEKDPARRFQRGADLIAALPSP